MLGTKAIKVAGIFFLVISVLLWMPFSQSAPQSSQHSD